MPGTLRDMADEYRRLFLKYRKELLQEFVREISLSDEDLIAKYRQQFKTFYPKSPKSGRKNDFFILTDSDGTFGYVFDEAGCIRIHLSQLLLGRLWFLLCDLDEDFGVKRAYGFPYFGQARRTLSEIERDPPKLRSKL